MQVLVLNCGSSSLKYQIIALDSETRVAHGRIEYLGTDISIGDAIAMVLDDVQQHTIDAVGHRVVHGGETFRQAQLIDADTIATLEDLIPLAPLHNPANIEGIRAAQEIFPALPHVAVFDTAFHTTMPRRATTYGIAPEIAAALSLRRFGFHGSSHKFVAQKVADFLDADLSSLRLITCHLGNGASVCAIEFGQSVETSMGMTPLEGLIMGTRCGDLDPAIVLELQRSGGMTLDEVDECLNKGSGLKGLSGVGADMRDIEAAAASGDDRARVAITVFCHRVKKYIGAYAASLGGVDAIVMTGGIGTNSHSVRRRILQRLQFLGLQLDEALNANAKPDPSQPVVALHSSRSRAQAFAVLTNEELMIAADTAQVLSGATRVRPPGPIPIAVSARHVHLNEATFKELFGADAELIKYKEISQPGQFACEQKLNLIGPKGRIDGVRLLGPLRSRNQIEISRTDEFRLGVDAPVRRSGQTQGSAPITIEGPAATVSLDEGLICAWRHIHMTADDAERYGVASGDHVEVAISGGERDLVFQDVLVRVAPAYRLEMHIDTDEANAAELGQSAQGDLVYTAVGDAAHADLRSKKI